MATLINKMLTLVGWDAEEEQQAQQAEQEEKQELERPQFIQAAQKKATGKVVNIHSASQFKVVIVQPEGFEDAQDICNHLKNKKPVIINLEDVEKECAQRIIDFLSGSVYALDGNIQKVSAGIFLIAPNNVDIMGDFKDELRSKGSFPWLK